jgi:hypothetical protein
MTEDPKREIPGNSASVQGRRDQFGRAIDLCIGCGKAAGSSLSEREAVACPISLQASVMGGWTSEQLRKASPLDAYEVS